MASQVAATFATLFTGGHSTSIGADLARTESAERLGLAQLNQQEADSRRQAYSNDLRTLMSAGVERNARMNELLVNEHLRKIELSIMQRAQDSALEGEKLDRDIKRKESAARMMMVPLEIAQKQLGIEDLKKQVELREVEVKENQWKLSQLRASESLMKLENEIKEATLRNDKTNLPKMHALRTAYLDVAAGKQDLEATQIFSDIMHNRFNIMSTFLKAGDIRSAQGMWKDTVEQGKKLGLELDPNKILSEKDATPFIGFRDNFLQQADIKKGMLLEEAKGNNGMNMLDFLTKRANLLRHENEDKVKAKENYEQSVVEPIIDQVLGQVNLSQKDGGIIDLATEEIAPMWQSDIINLVKTVLEPYEGIITNTGDAIEIINKNFTPVTITDNRLLGDKDINLLLPSILFDENGKLQIEGVEDLIVEAMNGDTSAQQKVQQFIHAALADQLDQQ